VHYESAGAGARVVCLVHGTGGAGNVWLHQLDGLADVARVVAPDLPGHGRSGGEPPRSIEEAAAFVVGFLDAVSVRSAIVGGHSMGGAIAQQLALAHPERVDGLVLVGTGARLRVLPRVLELLATDYPAGVDLLLQMGVGAAAPASLKALLRRSTAANPPGVVLGDLRACDVFDVIARIGAVRVPTLALCGEEDQLTPPKFARFFGETIAGARVVVIPGAGHFVQLEQPEATTRALREFLTRSAQGGGSMSGPRELSLEELRERIRAAGVTIAENRLAMVRKLLGDALAPVRALDSRAIKTEEPAVRFVPAREASHE
jgi:pimeloyl-ACP methyl ester carboxylesterase